MYRIVFIPKTAQWVVQLSRCYGLYWATIQEHSFANYLEATAYVTSIGLDQVYKNYLATYAHQVMQGNLV